MIWVFLLLAIPELTPEQAEAVRKIINDILQAADDAAPSSAMPPRFAPIGGTDPSGGVPPISDKSFTGGKNAETPSDGITRSPKANSQKRCLCGPESPCGGKCDPCNCLFNKLPKPGPGPLLSKQPIVGENHDR